MDRYPYLVSIPHCGVEVPPGVADRILLDANALQYYSDPGSESLYDFSSRVLACTSASVSRLIVDLNRPPYHIPPRYRDGVVKTNAADGTRIWQDGKTPDILLMHRLLMAHYFPYHARLDQLLGSGDILAAFDCHTMMKVGLAAQPDAGRQRPLICLSNNGDPAGHARKGGLSTCSAGWIQSLADIFREHFPGNGSVGINTPFSGGFISNAHYWHTGIPWIQIEINRSLYEREGSGFQTGVSVDNDRLRECRERIWDCLAGFYEQGPGTDS
ncbi:MAG: N-formylglutamate amidohydrolase [Methanolinea sp.]|nr:N-formylglutamate amidohydrolase [Methanolinea sp.]